jgi:integrase
VKFYSAEETLPDAEERGDLTVVELMDAFLKHADQYYRREDGTSTGEAQTLEFALTPLKELYGRELARCIGPKKLKTVRTAMIARGWCRTTINKSIQRVRSMFKWGVGNELVTSSVLEALRAVPGLKAGRSCAPEPDPVRPVAWHMVEAIKPHVLKEVWAIIQLQWITAMRPGEVVRMRACEIEMGEDLWVYRPAMHKNTHRKQAREVTLGPKAQEVIREFLTVQAQGYLFSPAAAVSRKNEARRDQRQTPLFPSAIRRRNRQRSSNNAGGHYTVGTYRRAVSRGCESAFPVPEGMTDAAEIRKHHQAHHWHPHQLRHSAATRIRKEHGLEAAQVILGHKNMQVTEIYAEANVELARKIMRIAG